MKWFWVMLVSAKTSRITLVVGLLVWSGFTTTTLYFWRNVVTVGHERQQTAGFHQHQSRLNFVAVEQNVAVKTTSHPMTQNSVRKNDLVLDDIFISVKTSGKFHETRLQVILQTWWNNCRNQTVFFTDVDAVNVINMTDLRIVNTHCGSSHFRVDLCCKMGYEYDSYMKSGKRWWCHFDDDNYVNVDRLMSVLSQYDSSQFYYLGRPSLSYPIGAMYSGEKVAFWFATGGAGFCISKGLANLMSPWSRHGQFRKTCDAIKLPDDCTVGFIVHNRLKVNLTVTDGFNSHLQMLRRIRFEDLSAQVTLSHSADQGVPNVLEMRENAAFAVSKDPTRFLSLHCLLEPRTEWCPKNISTHAVG